MTLGINREVQFSRLNASDFKGNAHMQGTRTNQPSILDLIQLAVCRYGGMQVKIRDGAHDYTGSGGARASKFSVRTTFYADPLISPEKFWSVILYVCTSVCPYACMYICMNGCFLGGRPGAWPSKIQGEPALEAVESSKPKATTYVRHRILLGGLQLMLGSVQKR